MRLDSTHPGEAQSGAVSGTLPPAVGVDHAERAGGDPAGAAERRGIGLRGALLLLWMAFALLGQGERCLVDERFASPGATLATYWEAMRSGDDDTVAQCHVGGPHDLPFPGMLWFMPPTREVRLEAIRSLPVAAGRVLVTYEVCYRPDGARVEQRLRTGHELVRQRGEWRIERPLGEASVPEWTPVRRAVDS